MTSFTTTFGGSAVSPAEVAYAAYSISANLVLYWPQFSQGQTNVAARFMNITATANGLNVAMPDATLNSVGYDAIIFNAGSDNFNVVGYAGGAIVTITPGQTYYLMLNNNTTQNGGWQTVQFGVGTSSANAAALAGLGLLAAGGTLNVNLNGILVSTSYTITAAQRAILQVWTGGTGTITLPSAASVGNGFFFPIANNGSGSVTISASDQIDGASTSVFPQTQSAFVISTGMTWYTVGKGLQNTFSVTLLNLNVGGAADVTLTSAQAQNIIQQYTGVLTGNINVIVPNTVQLYYVFNNTSGAFTLTVKTAAGTGIQVAQGTHAILYCDGTNVVNGFTATITNTIGILAGSSVSPSIFVQGSPSTGIYSPAANQIAITANGTEVTDFVSATSSVNYLQVSATATGNAPTITATGTDTNIGIILMPKGTGAIGMSAAVILGGTIDNTIIGGSTAAAITGTTITATSNFSGNLTGNVTGNCSGSSGSTTGNAATATALQTARNINGVAFDGTSNITVAAAAGTLTGATLAAGVTGSSLTSVGTITSGTWSGLFGAVSGANLTKLTAANISSGTATINITGNAGTVTTNANLTGPITSVGNVTSVANSIALPGSPTTTTQASNDSSTNIATTAFANPANSIGANGYQTLPSGLIIQWGTVTAAVSAGSQSVSFGITFPNNVFSVQAQATSASGISGGDVGYATMTATTTSGFTMERTCSRNWIAIGN